MSDSGMALRSCTGQRMFLERCRAARLRPGAQITLPRKLSRGIGMSQSTPTDQLPFQNAQDWTACALCCGSSRYHSEAMHV
eukprot:6240591-Heterocapsa_arctica.AAC.1